MTMIITSCKVPESVTAVPFHPLSLFLFFLLLVTVGERVAPFLQTEKKRLENKEGEEGDHLVVCSLAPERSALEQTHSDPLPLPQQSGGFYWMHPHGSASGGPAHADRGAKRAAGTTLLPRETRCAKKTILPRADKTRIHPCRHRERAREEDRERARRTQGAL